MTLLSVSSRNHNHSSQQQIPDGRQMFGNEIVAYDLRPFDTDFLLNTFRTVHCYHPPVTLASNEV